MTALARIRRRGVAAAAAIGLLLELIVFVAVPSGAPAEAKGKARPVTMRSLQSALVPALRGNRAGRLRQGVLPRPGAGFTKLYTDEAKPAFGNLTRDRVRDAVAVIISSSGAGGSDQFVEMYTNGKKRRLGHFDPAAVDSRAYHASVTKLRIRHRKARVYFTTYNNDGILNEWVATLRWNGRRLVTHARTIEPVHLA